MTRTLVLGLHKNAQTQRRLDLQTRPRLLPAKKQMADRRRPTRSHDRRRLQLLQQRRHLQHRQQLRSNRGQHAALLRHRNGQSDEEPPCAFKAA